MKNVLFSKIQKAFRPSRDTELRNEIVSLEQRISLITVDIQNASNKLNEVRLNKISIEEKIRSLKLLDPKDDSFIHDGGMEHILLNDGIRMLPGHRIMDGESVFVYGEHDFSHNRLYYSIISQYEYKREQILRDLENLLNEIERLRRMKENMVEEKNAKMAKLGENPNANE